MKKTRYHILLFVLSLLSSIATAQEERTVEIDVKSIKSWIANAPEEFSKKAISTAILIDLPLLNGETIPIKVLESPMIVNGKTDIRTYSFVGFDDPNYHGRLMVSARGMDAHIFTPNGRQIIQPVNWGGVAHRIQEVTGEYPHLENDAQYSDEFSHRHASEGVRHKHEATARNMMTTSYNIGATIRKFRMHVISDREYALAVLDGATLNRANVFTAITAAVNGMNAIYQKEMAVMLTLDESIQTIYLGANPAGFAAGGGANNPSWLTESLQHHVHLENNTTSDGSGGTNVMVPRNSYDVGHLFSGRVSGNQGEGGGGAAFLEGVCNDAIVNELGPFKAGGGSGMPDPEGGEWIDLLSHEFTHQFNADHTWSGNSGNCTADQFSGGAFAVEPGSGSTIVSYNAICPFPNPNNPPTGKDNDNIPNPGNTSYYHTISIKQVDDWIKSATATCETEMSSDNQVPNPDKATPNCTANYTIPPRTPFSITGSATDGNTPLSELTYCWEQMDTAANRFDPIDGPTLKAGAGSFYPIFRSFAPVSSATRVFPQWSTIVSGNYNGDAQNAATLTQSNWQGELLPESTGTINLRLTVRDNNTTAGGVEFDDVELTVAGTVPFAVTSQNSNPAAVNANSQMTVTWDKAGTDAAPFNYANVTIKLSVDGGLTYPYNLGTTANDGTEDITIPSGIPGTTKARVMVECGVSCFSFFDINNADFTIINSGCAPNGATFTGSSDATANVGDASLNLSLMPVYGTTLSSKTLNLTNTSPVMELTLNDGGNCNNNFSETNPYQPLEFYAPSTGNFTISQSGVTIPFSVMNLYNDSFDAANTCSNWLASSEGTSISGGNPISNIALVSGKKYVLVLSSSNFGSGNTGAATINFSPTVVENGAPNPGVNYTYTYVAVDTNNVISKIDANADFRSLTGGGSMYTVYGLSVLNTDLATVNGLAGQNFSVLGNGTYCVNLSTNTIKLTINGSSSPTGQGEGTCLAGDEVLPTEIPNSAGTYTYRSSTTLMNNGMVEIESGYNVSFLAGTSVTLKNGFHAKANSTFLAKIEACSPFVPNQPDIKVYRYSPKTKDALVEVTNTTTTLADQSIAGEIFPNGDAQTIDFKIAPNPSNLFTNLNFDLPTASQVNLTVFDMNGKVVKSILRNTSMTKGRHQIQYTPSDIRGGMYYVVLQASEQVATQKMILIR
ncbi:MAG: reprolysin-like metallopeptidase [Bacteroidota bacterium]